MDRVKDLEKVIENLETSKTEDEIVKNLTKIVKGFNVSLYKKRILSNPYYKSLIDDVKEEVHREIDIIRDSIVDEVLAIDNEIKRTDNKYLDKLNELKRDCISLLYEIDERKKDIDKLK